MKLSDTYNLKALFPGLAKQWHPVKNGSLTPDRVTPYSAKKVWWTCDKGHEWQAQISNRTNGNGCPHCHKIFFSDEYNLQVINPLLSRQWHPTKNGKLTPVKVTPFSNKKVWWICDKGHEWQANISNRTKGSGCPYCRDYKASKEVSLSAIRPDLAKQWHPFKNGSLTPDIVKPNSAKKVWWTCDKGHEWQACITARNHGSGCPYCATKVTEEYNLLALHPDIAKQWHPSKNGSLTPDIVTPYSGKRVWWICARGHEWEAVIAQRNFHGTGCPYCSHKKASKEYNLLTVAPGIAKQWHPTKNGKLTPDKVTPGSGKKVWWICDKGHEWKTAVNNRRKGSGCHYCAINRRKRKNTTGV